MTQNGIKSGDGVMAIKLTEIKRQAGATARVPRSPAERKTEVELVRDSFTELSKHGDALSARFYERFFQQYPQVAPLFEGVSTQGQQKKFFASLVLLMQNIEEKEVFNDYLLGLGARHIHYGVKKAYYPMIAENLLAVFAEFSGEKWTALLSQAWENTLNNIISVMLSAHVEADSSETAKVSQDQPLQESWADAILAGVNTAIMMIDRDTNITFANRSALEMLTEYTSELKQIIPGFDVDSLIGSNISQLSKVYAERWATLSDPAKLPYRTELELGPLNVSITMTAVLDKVGRYKGTAIEWANKLQTNNASNTKSVQSTSKVMSSVLDSLLSISNDGIAKRLEGSFDGDQALLQTSINNALDKIDRMITEGSQASLPPKLPNMLLSETSLNLSGGLETQHALLHESSSVIEALTNSLQQSVDDTRSVKQFSSEVIEQAENSITAMTQAIDTISRINASAHTMAELISDIEQLAFQTNLLGLNAAVEATHAGEQGRGMAVIATEIRSQAKRITGQAKAIKDLIEANEYTVQQSSQLVDESGRAMHEIVSGFGKVNELISEISTVAAEHSQKITKIDKACTKVNDITESHVDIVKQLSNIDLA